MPDTIRLRALRPDIRLRDLQPDDADWLVAVHAAHYRAAEGFDASFAPLVASVVARHLAHHDQSCERAWIAEGDGRLGSILCARDDPETARLRLFFVVEHARGTGLGDRLLRDLTGFARASGYRRLRVATYASHRAACALYARRGFVLTAARPVENFGRRLVEQAWEKPL